MTDKELRKESIINGYMPKEGEEVCYWDFYGNEPWNGTYSSDILALAYIGAVHKTRKECNEWGIKYSKAFLNYKS